MENNTDTSVLSNLESNHRDSLLLCWKIREGFRNDIPIKRIKKYLDWFWENQLKHLFELEEKHIFSTIAPDDKLRKKALSQHRKLRKLFEVKNESEFLKSITLIEEELELHIRFAEKELFNTFMKTATPKEIAEIEKNCNSFAHHQWKDPFWEVEKEVI